MASGDAGGDRRSGQWADSGYTLDAPRGFVCLGQPHQLSLVAVDSLIEVAQVRSQLGNGFAREQRQHFGSDHRGATHLLRPLRQHHAELGEQTADAVDRRRALLDEPPTHAMQREDRLLLHRLHRHKAHVRTPHRFADRLGVVAVVLRALAIRRHKARHHDPDLVTVAHELARPLVRTGARLDADPTRRQRCDQLHQLLAPHRLAQHHLPRRIHTVHREHRLCEALLNFEWVMRQQG